jgi:beta-N-acetylhexosaminidase
MLGQMIVARFDGLHPSASFLERIRRGQIGGVILFGDNLTSDPARTRALTGTLQAAARQGGNPPLLIMTDQEGGMVRRLPGPPVLAASQMSATGTALAQGRAAGALLRSAGINVDLAPVADVETVAGAFLGSRSFGSSPELVAAHACAFAHGLASEGIGYTLKHFPGLGAATTSTDDAPVSINLPMAALRADYLPYRHCAASSRAMVMVSSAVYPELTGPVPAVMSSLTYRRELRIASPTRPPATISDDLETPALAGERTPARTAINAGLDLAMYASSEQGSAVAYQALERDLRAGQLDARRIRAAAQTILQLKHALGTP